jgi:hypothetical protein
MRTRNMNPNCKCKCHTFHDSYPKRDLDCCICVCNHSKEAMCEGCETSAEAHDRTRGRVTKYEHEHEAPSMVVGSAPMPSDWQENVIEWPPHYNKGKIQMTDYCLDQKFGACSTAIIKYVTRSRWKGKRLEDLKKAKWYLEKLIATIEAGGEE